MSYGKFAYGSSYYGGGLGILDIVEPLEKYVYVSNTVELEVSLEQPLITGGYRVSSPLLVDLEIVIGTPTVVVGTIHDDPLTIIGNANIVSNINYDFSLKRKIIGDSTFTIGRVKSLFSIEKAFPWWDQNWTYRRSMYIKSGPLGLPAKHPIEVYLNSDIKKRNKVRDDYGDIVVCYLASRSPERWQVLSRSAAQYSQSEFRVQFYLEKAISPDTISENEYFVYYGNPKLVNTYNMYTYIHNDWPVVVDPYSGDVAFTRLGEDWAGGHSNVVGSSAVLKFYGDQIRVVSNMGPSYGIMAIRIDGGDWEQVDLYSALDRENTLVYEARGLTIGGEHTLEMKVSGDRNTLSSSIEVNFTNIYYKMYNIPEDVGEECNSKLLWQSVLGGRV